MSDYNGLRCVECDEALTGKQKKYCSKRCSKRYYNRKQYEKREILNAKSEALLMASLQNGLTVEQSCRQAGIGTTTFYDRQANDPEFADKIKAAREFTEVNARRKVAEAINSGDMKTSRWYLERKAKREFSSRHEHTGADGTPISEGMSEDKFNALLERAVGKAKSSGQGAAASGKHRKDAPAK